MDHAEDWREQRAFNNALSHKVAVLETQHKQHRAQELDKRLVRIERWVMGAIPVAFAIFGWILGMMPKITSFIEAIK